jgi:hemophore-related protein
MNMVELSSTGLAVAVGALLLSLATGTGVASADPDIGPLLNTTCTYSQAMAALNAQSPAVAQQFAANPAAGAWLRSFLGSPVDQRQRMIQSVQALPGVAQYTGLVLDVANTCNNY